VSVVVHHLIDPALAEHGGNHHGRGTVSSHAAPDLLSITSIPSSLEWFFNSLLVLLCQIKIFASEHVGKYNVMC